MNREPYEYAVGQSDPVILCSYPRATGVSGLLDGRSYADFALRYILDSGSPVTGGSSWKDAENHGTSHTATPSGDMS